jgi:hypothetical protein
MGRRYIKLVVLMRRLLSPVPNCWGISSRYVLTGLELYRILTFLAGPETQVGVRQYSGHAT